MHAMKEDLQNARFFMKKNEKNSATKLTNDLNTKYSDLAFPFTQIQY